MAEDRWILANIFQEDPMGVAKIARGEGKNKNRKASFNLIEVLSMLLNAS